MEEIKGSSILDLEQNDVTFTGERLVVNKEVKHKFDNVLQEHLNRYELATSYVKNKKVLDAACGAGYGSKMLELAGALEVIGVDISQECVKNATETYHSDRTMFQVGDVNALPFEDESFDVVVSFETIEHIPDGARWICEAFRVLKPEGIFVVSTPNRILTNPGLFFGEQPLNHFHKFEYSINEFTGELLKKFDVIQLYGQTFIHNTEDYGTMVLRNARNLYMDIAKKAEEVTAGYELIALGNVKNTQPCYIVAVCRKNTDKD